MNILFSWILPILIGAFIGYITNSIAIKMLFRPLTEVKLFSFRLPFTPGILPKERHKLAQSIGRMVEQELLTSEVLKERLEREEVREKIGSTLGSYTDKLLEKPLAQLLEERDENFPAREIINDFVNSDVFDSLLEEIIRNLSITRAGILGEMLATPAKDLIKYSLLKELRSHSRGEPSFYRRALEKLSLRYPGISLREFISLGRNKKTKVDAFLTDKTMNTLKDNVDTTLSSIDVKELVTDRINSLDMIRVEKIILDIMAGQLKWINFFGAILGGLIGLSQAILGFFTSPR